MPDPSEGGTQLLAPALRVQGGEDLVQMPQHEKRRLEIGEQMRLIEGDIFLLSAKSGESNPASGDRFERLCAERTQLAVELLLIQYR